ncbi:unnamed protein product [Gongylonema pulchrum]|uniref:Uncharacterized protein n=1 Tax=Gongylonema pulchrum TaxID=637853 RepID=A0A183EQZ7_9BILA|nr:unnamed protein product [Gongylonema pulchrum]
MSDRERATPITIRLEIEHGAPLIHFQFEDEVRDRAVPVEKRAMTEARKAEKAVARAKVEDPAAAAVAAERTSDSVSEGDKEERAVKGGGATSSAYAT